MSLDVVSLPVTVRLPQISQYQALRVALREFRDAWQEGMPERLHESAEHVEAVDPLGQVLGDPAMTERFRRLLLGGLHTPMRRAVRQMAYGSLSDRVGARFLFALACRDYDVRAAGLSMSPPLMPEFSPWYAERAIRRAFEVIGQLDKPRPVRRRCKHDGCVEQTDRLLCRTHRMC